MAAAVEAAVVVGAAVDVEAVAVVRDAVKIAVAVVAAEAAAAAIVAVAAIAGEIAVVQDEMVGQAGEVATTMTEVWFGREGLQKLITDGGTVLEL